MQAFLVHILKIWLDKKAGIRSRPFSNSSSFNLTDTAQNIYEWNIFAYNRVSDKKR